MHDRQGRSTADLTCNRLSHRARSAHISDGLQHSLLSCGQRCDSEYKVVFNRGEAKVIDGPISIDGDIVLRRKHDTKTGIRTVPLVSMSASTTRQQYRKRQGEMSNNVYEFTKIYDVTQYLHATAFSPVKSSFIKATSAGNFAEADHRSPIMLVFDKVEALVHHKGDSYKNWTLWMKQ
jgi:hypothetical protein